jgi:hypothetical protein
MLSQMRECRCHGLNAACFKCEGRGVVDEADDPHLVEAPRPADADVPRWMKAGRSTPSDRKPRNASARDQPHSGIPEAPAVGVVPPPVARDEPWQLAKRRVSAAGARPPSKPPSALYVDGRCALCKREFERTSVIAHLREVHGVNARWMSKRQLRKEAAWRRRLEREAEARAKSLAKGGATVDPPRPSGATDVKPGGRTPDSSSVGPRKPKGQRHRPAHEETLPGKAHCPHCGKLVSLLGLSEHVRAKHARAG